jgi:hypothetical protein
MKTSIDILKLVVWIDGSDHVIDEISFSDTATYPPWSVSGEGYSVEGEGHTLEEAVRDFVKKMKERSEEQDEYSSGL